MVANQDRDRLCRRCAALHIMVGKREQRICFRVISADRAGRDAMGLCPEAADHAALVIGQRFDFDRVALVNTRAGMSASFMNATMRPPKTPRYRSSRV